MLKENGMELYLAEFGQDLQGSQILQVNQDKIIGLICFLNLTAPQDLMVFGLT